jgi:hypothetical protein
MRKLWSVAVVLGAVGIGSGAAEAQFKIGVAGR